MRADAGMADFDEPSLYAMGFNRRSVQAFINIARVVGTATTGATVPEIAAQAETTAASLNSLAADVEELKLLFGGTPTMPEQDPGARDLSVAPPSMGMVQQVEFLQTEVRQLAEQQTVLLKLIDELRQGTML